MQDFYNALFTFFFIRNNKLTVNLSQIFLHNGFNNIADIVFFSQSMFTQSLSWFVLAKFSIFRIEEFQLPRDQYLEMALMIRELVN